MGSNFVCPPLSFLSLSPSLIHSCGLKTGNLQSWWTSFNHRIDQKKPRKELEPLFSIRHCVRKQSVYIVHIVFRWNGNRILISGNRFDCTHRNSCCDVQLPYQQSLVLTIICLRPLYFKPYSRPIIIGCTFMSCEHFNQRHFLRRQEKAKIWEEVRNK